MGLLHKIAETLRLALQWVLLAPLYVYRYTFSSFMGRHCRHEPSCSAYAIEAIRLNGAWRGFWLMVSRVWRCGPFGTHGYDPVPDLRGVQHPMWRAWRYGVWAGPLKE